MTDYKNNDYNLLKSIIDSVEAKLTGKDSQILIDEEPGRCFSVGILNANNDNDRVDGSPLRRPESMGFFIRFKKDIGLHEFKCKVNFSLYYRIRASFNEQLRDMAGKLPENEEIASIPKYRRIDKTINSFFIIPKDIDDQSVIDCSEINTSLEEAILEVQDEIMQDKEIWPFYNFKIFGKNLISQKAYNSIFLSAKIERVPRWKIHFEAKLIGGSSNNKLLILLTNLSKPTEFFLAWHCPEIFNVHIYLKGQPKCFYSEPFTPIRNDYRYKTKTWGKGINTVLKVNDDIGEAWTENFPIYYQPRIRSRGGFEDSTSTEILSKDNNLKSLINIQKWLEEYDNKWNNEIFQSKNTDKVIEDMKSDQQAYQEEIKRFKLGINILINDPLLRRAFLLMNYTFMKSGVKNWRLFQICFVVNNLSSLYYREHQEVQWAKKEQDIVDVLWFPTGGGKTEAFLAVVITALFYDRLRGKLIGTTAWLRYPLRMLSIQQLQRLINIVVQAEIIRGKEEDIHLIGEPFSIGFYVGQQNAPNELTFPGKGQNLIDQLYDESLLDPNGLVRYRVLSYCPICGSDSIKLIVDKEFIRLRHICNNCSYSPNLYISDSEIYRYIPSILVGTVDRLARSGETDKFSIIFKGPSAKCPKHGYTNYDECLESKVCKEKLQSVLAIKDPCPSLLLQDEIHLLRESLGTYDSHYEGLIDVISRRFGTGIPPKRMAATATIEGLEQHAYHLYVRDSRCFPVKGMDINESAYIELEPGGNPARLYVGVLPSGRDADDVSKKLGEHLCYLAEQRFDDEKDDIYHDFLLIYVNEKNTASDIKADWQDKFTMRILTGDKTLDEVRQVIAQVESDGSKSYPDRLNSVIATSIVGHGLDLERLNQMVIVGIPRSIAEYIQASSRSGRSHMGLIFTVFRWQNRRNVSMYEHFLDIHDRLYQLVQPVPVNRVSAFSIERTITGILSALIYNYFGPMLYDKKKIRLNTGKSVIKALEDKNLLETDIVDAITEVYLFNFIITEAYRNQLKDIINRTVRKQLRLLSTKSSWSFHSRLDPKPVSSLREVGEQINFGIVPDDLKTARLLQLGRIGSKKCQ